MQAIIDRLTQARYVDAVTIQPGPWEGIDVSISDAAAMMQVYELDHAGHFMGGDWRQEALVQPGTLSLGRAGGVRFRTNPDTPGLPATIDAFAHAEGDPIIAGLRPRATLPTIFGPILFDGGQGVGNSGDGSLQTVFQSPVPGNWGSLLLTIDATALAPTGWHFQAQWFHGGVAITNFDWYFQSKPVSLAIPILGDMLVLRAACPNGGAAINLIPRAYLTNFAPFSVWARSEWSIFHLTSTVQPIQAMSSLQISLPLFAGTAIISGSFDNNLTFQIDGLDEVSGFLSRPLPLTTPVSVIGESLLLAPHRNFITINNANAVDVHGSISIIGQRT